jgi:hypothetical protein
VTLPLDPSGAENVFLHAVQRVVIGIETSHLL